MLPPKKNTNTENNQGGRRERKMHRSQTARTTFQISPASGLAQRWYGQELLLRKKIQLEAEQQERMEWNRNVPTKTKHHKVVHRWIQNIHRYWGRCTRAQNRVLGSHGEHSQVSSKQRSTPLKDAANSTSIRRGQDVAILLDSQAAIKALSWNQVYTGVSSA